jgi:CRISPR-associated endonuclease/helicase Cas3
MELLAHSGRASQGIGPQGYAEHVEAVHRLAEQNIRTTLRYRCTPKPALGTAATLASIFHDLGKLEDDNQAVLRTSETAPLPVNHVDAGTAHLCSLRQAEAALAVYAHHLGLCDLPSELAKDQKNSQDSANAALRDYRIKLQTDARLSKLLALHYSVVTHIATEAPIMAQKFSGLERRIVLSCLVDADHSDTAGHYGEKSQRESPSCRWRERLAALDAYVQNLGPSTEPRNALRSRVYHACRSAPPAGLIWACDSPVGSGKTTAVMAYLLQAAIALDLRHIFVVLPYTNIVRQSVDVYRESLVLTGEDPERVVAAHHHQAEFSAPDVRYLTTLWESPIIVTTAVQFFETLGSNETARLRKLHELPGSAVFVDEAHAAMPIHLWPFMWDQLKLLIEEWSCRLVLGSGSLQKFWENPRILGEGKTAKIPSLVPSDVGLASAAFEKRRVRYQSRKEPLTLAGLCDWIQEHSGPRVAVLNTVQSAAVVARELRRRGVQTLHLSTALAPLHRDSVLRRARERLDRGDAGSDWVLVATSCVESGVDLSFVTAFRERCRAASLVQIGGRVNRHGEHAGGVVWDFTLNDPLLPAHPDFKHGRDVVEELFLKGMWDQDLTTLMTYALEQEFKRHSAEREIDHLFQLDAQGSYPAVAKLTRLITSDTRLAVIDPGLIANLDQHRHIDLHVLISRSVQLWATKIQKLGLREIGKGVGLYAWEYEYDPQFLGVMEGILKQIDIGLQGYAII